MGDKEQREFQLSFNGFLKVDFQGSRVTSDGGLLLVRELDERLGLGKLIDEHLTDSRQGSNKKFPLADLVRQSVYSRLAGYEDLNDAVRVSADPTFRLLGSKKNWDRGGALMHVAEAWVVAIVQRNAERVQVAREVCLCPAFFFTKCTANLPILLEREVVLFHTPQAVFDAEPLGRKLGSQSLKAVGLTLDHLE